MALETKFLPITTAAYAIIGTNVTSLSARSVNLKSFSVVVLPTLGAAPLVGETDIVTADDGKFSFAGSAADIYALATEGNTSVQLVRE